MRNLFEQHPIQLTDITVQKLNLTVNDPQSACDYEGELTLNIELGQSEFTQEDPNVSIGLRVRAEAMLPTDPTSQETGVGDGSPAFSIEVELLGHFQVDYSKFKFEHMDSWARVNAPFLLLPYVREHVYALAVRGGIRGFLFPLFIQPRSMPATEQRSTTAPD